LMNGQRAAPQWNRSTHQIEERCNWKGCKIKCDNTNFGDELFDGKRRYFWKFWQYRGDISIPAKNADIV
jgi:hypothetical protein